jgi:hypothetical protein
MENNSFGTNTTAQNIVGTIAVGIVGFLMFGIFYETFWKHFTYKQKRFFAKFFLLYSLAFALLIGRGLPGTSPKPQMDRWDVGGKTYYVPRKEKLHLYPDTYDTGEKFGE